MLTAPSRGRGNSISLISGAMFRVASVRSPDIFYRPARRQLPEEESISTDLEDRHVGHDEVYAPSASQWAGV